MTTGADEALAAHELDLVSRAAQGDDAAFDRFFERNAPAVQLLVERLLGPGAAADAVVVEAFEKTVRRLPLLGARNSSPALYVLSTARNGAYAALGRGRPTADGGPLAALLALPSRQRELLALRELGLSEDDCAEVAGIDPGEVGVQVARARLRLTDELEGLTLSTVFADDRAERLLAAEVVRVEGQGMPESLEAEISRHADEDSRFAAALSAVRSPSRSVGQLPAVSGPSRLVGDARAAAVGAGRSGAGGSSSRPASGFAATGATAAAAAAAAQAPSDAGETGVAAGPRAVPRSTSDPYDADIGDEMAWGIVEDDEDEAFRAPAASAGAPSVDAPTDAVWEDGAGAVSEEPTRVVPSAGKLRPKSPAGPGGEGDPSLADPFAGWDDALDWDEDEKEWAAGPGAAGAAAAGAAAAASATAAPEAQASSAPPMAPTNPIADVSSLDVSATPPTADAPPSTVDLGETRAFDAVAAGLVDADPVPLPAYDEPSLDDVGIERRKSPWRWVVWFIALMLLFAGVAFAAYAWQKAKQDPTLPPASTLDKTTPAVTQSTPASTPKSSSSSTSKKSSSSSSTTKKKSTSTSSSSGSSSSSSGSSSTSTRSTGSTSTGTAGGTGTGTGTTSTPKKSTTTGTTSTGNTAADEPEVVSGESTSGGAVRGSSDGTGGTTP